MLAMQKNLRVVPLTNCISTLQHRISLHEMVYYSLFCVSKLASFEFVQAFNYHGK